MLNQTQVFCTVCVCVCLSVQVLQSHLSDMTKYRQKACELCKFAVRTFSPAIDPNTLFYRLCCGYIKTFLLSLTPSPEIIFSFCWLVFQQSCFVLLYPHHLCFSLFHQSQISFYLFCCWHSITTFTSNSVSIHMWPGSWLWK